MIEKIVIAICTALLLSATLVHAQFDRSWTYEQAIHASPYPIVVPVHCNQRILYFVLDTGISRSLLDSSLKDLAGEKLRDEEIGTAAGGVRMEFRAQPRLLLGDHVLRGDEVMISDLSKIRRALGVKIDGLLGTSSLADLVVEINNDLHHLRISDGAHYSHDGMQKLVTTPRAGCPAIKLEFGAQSAFVELDTGATNGISLIDPLFRKLIANGMVEAATEQRGYAELLGNTQQRNEVTFFKKGELMGKPLLGTPLRNGQQISTMGLGFLGYYNLIIDFQIEALFYKMRKNACPPDKTEVWHLIGAVCEFLDGEVIIKHIQKDGPMAVAGLHEGDKLLRVGQLSGDKINYFALGDLCLSAREKPIEIEVRREGKVFETKLTLKPCVDTP